MTMRGERRWVMMRRVVMEARLRRGIVVERSVGVSSIPAWGAQRWSFR
jgi:hypothetical protein